jgi:hypothetical protein
MATLIVRNLDDRVAKRLREEARRNDTSVNGLVVRMISENIGRTKMRKRGRVYRDLDRLAGTWSRAEARAVERGIRAQRSVDPDLWR